MQYEEDEESLKIEECSQISEIIPLQLGDCIEECKRSLQDQLSQMQGPQTRKLTRTASIQREIQNILEDMASLKSSVLSKIKGEPQPSTPKF